MLELKFMATDFVSAIAAKVGDAVSGLTSRLRSEGTAQSGLWAKMGDDAKLLGVALAGAATIAIGFGLATAKVASDFQSQMTLIHTQAGAVTEDLGSLSDKVLTLSAATGVSADNLAEGLYHIESAGFRSTQAIDMLTAAAKLSVIGQADMQDTAQAVIGVMAAYPDKFKSAADAAAILNAVVGTGDMRLQQLDKAIATGILPTANTFGLSLTDVGAALATLTDNVTPADEAATRLRMTFSMMGAPTGAAQKALGSIGINALQLATDMRKPNGLLVAIQDLKDHLAHIDISGFAGGIDQVRKDLTGFGLTEDEVTQALGKLGPTASEQADILARAFGGGRSSAAILTLITEFDRLQSKYSQITTGAAGFDAAWNETLGTTQVRWSRFTAAIQDDAIRVGLQVLPILNPVIDVLANAAAGLPGLVTAALNSLATNPVVREVKQLAADFSQIVQESVPNTQGLRAADISVTDKTVPIPQANWQQAGDIIAQRLGDAITQDAPAIGRGIVDALSQAVGGMDWYAIGTQAAPAAEGFIMGFLSEAMNPNLWVEATKRHPLEALGFVATVATMVFGPEDLVVGKLATFLERIPFAGTLLAWVIRGLNAAGGPIRRLMGEFGATTIDAFGRALGKPDIAVDIERALSGASAGFKGFFDGIGARFLEFGGTLGKLGGAAARSLADGFWNGLKAVWDATGGKVLGRFIADFRTFGETLWTDLLIAFRMGAAEATSFLRIVFEGWGGKELPGMVSEFRTMSGDAWDGLISAFRSGATLVQQIWDGMVAAANRAGGGIWGAIKGGLNQAVDVLNVFAHGVNKALGIFGVSIPDIPHLAAGGRLQPVRVGPGFKTDGPMAVVGEGRGPEYVIPTEPAHRANATALWVAAGKDLGFYASGGILGDALLTPVHAVVNGAMASLAGFARTVASGVVGQAFTGAADWLGGHLADMFKGSGASGNVMQWIATALALTGTPASWAPGLATIIQYESGGNPQAINLSDSNAAAGDPSRGLMQTIGATFERYRLQALPDDIFDPIANLAAAINYIKARYGDIANVPGLVALAQGGAYVGYDSGGVLQPGLTLAYNGTGRPETVLPAPSSQGRPVQMQNHTHLYLDGQLIETVIQRVFDRRLSGLMVAIQ